MHLATVWDYFHTMHLRHCTNFLGFCKTTNPVGVKLENIQCFCLKLDDNKPGVGLTLKTEGLEHFKIIE